MSNIGPSPAASSAGSLPILPILPNIGSTTFSSSTSSSTSRCNTYVEELKSTYSLSPADPCPVCQHLVAFHLRDPNHNSSSTSSSSKRNGSKSVLPQWGTDYKVVRLFLDRFEQVLIADLVDKEHWPRLLLKSTPGGNDGYWVRKNIVEANLPWA